MRARAPWALFLLVVGCSGGTEDGAEVRDGGADLTDAQPRDAGPRDGGPRDGGPPADADPILARTATLTHDCTGALGEMAEIGEVGGHDFVRFDSGEAFALRLAGTATPTWDPDAPKDLLIARLDADGVPGVPVAVGLPDAPRNRLATGALGDAILAVWQEGEALRSAVVETDGDLVSGPHTIAQTGTWPNAHAILSHPSGALVTWATSTDPGPNGVGRIHAAIVDADGASIGAPRVVAEWSSGFAWLAPTIVESGDGYAFAFAAADADGGAVWFGRFDADGAPVGEVVQVAATADRYLGFAPDRVALHPYGDGFVAAWATPKPTDTARETTWTMVRLARLDTDGAVVDGPHDLDAPIDDIDLVEPALFAYGDTTALTWARGEHIYACAGCVPDHDVHLVLLDPERLAPVSDVATIDGAPTGGGLLRRRHVVSGEHIATTFDVTFHVWDRYGDGVLSCVAR